MRLLIGVLGLVMALGVLAGCGDDDGGGGGAATTPEATADATEDASGGGGGGESLTLTADPGGAIAWEPGSLSAKSGSVTIKLVNDSSTPHAVEVEGNGVEEITDDLDPGQSGELMLDLEPGEYEIYCAIGDHAAQGMEGTLTVE